jgi:CHASE2 domain-containing sensor protein
LVAEAGTEPALTEDAATARRLQRHWLVLAIAATLLVLALLFTDATRRLDNVLYDFALRLAHKPSTADTIIVAIDERALAEIGAWPWPRARHADLVRRLTALSPQAIAYDVLFLDPAPDPRDDRALAQAVSASRRVCLPLLIEAPGPNGAAARVVPPQPEIAEAAAGLGHVSLHFDPDGVSRRADLEIAAGGRITPQLMRCAQQVAAGRPMATTFDRPVAVAAPPERRSTVLIPFAGGAGQFRTISAASVLAGEAPANFFRSRYVLVGATAAGLSDSHSTPLSSAAGSMSGIELQAHLLEGLIHGALIQPAPKWLAVLALLAPVWLQLLGLRIAHPRANLMLAGVGLVAVLVLSAAALAAGRVWIPPFPALLPLLFVTPIWAWMRLEAASTYLMEELTRFEHGRSPPPSGVDLVERRITGLRRAVQRTRELQLQRDQAVQLISHDLRAPQSAILALLEGPAGGAVPEVLSTRISSHARRTLSLADNFTHLAKAVNGAVTVEPLDLADVLEVVFDALWPLAARAGVELQRSDGAAEAWVLGDRSLLIRAVTNLADNAIKYSPRGGRVRGGVTINEGRATLAIEDQGPGVTPQMRADLFSAYRRGVGLSAPGLGLGLAVVAEVARRHGGEATCESEPGQGARFVLSLPLEPGAQRVTSSG